jgi:hypothetical protein
MSTLSKITTILISAVIFSAVGYVFALIFVHYFKIVLAKLGKGTGGHGRA